MEPQEVGQLCHCFRDGGLVSLNVATIMLIFSRVLNSMLALRFKNMSDFFPTLIYLVLCTQLLKVHLDFQFKSTPSSTGLLVIMAVRRASGCGSKIMKTTGERLSNCIKSRVLHPVSRP